MAIAMQMRISLSSTRLQRKRLGRNAAGGTCKGPPRVPPALMDEPSRLPYNRKVLKVSRFPRRFRAPGVFAPLVRALVFKTSGRFEKGCQWVRFPYTPANKRTLYRGESLDSAEKLGDH